MKFANSSWQASNIRFAMKRALLLLVAALGCSKTEARVEDAGIRHATPDSLPLAADSAPAVSIDFAIEGCPDFDAESLSCTGPAPLALRFVPLVTAPVVSYVWNFGEVPPATDPGATPLHVYDLPGIYSVTLVVTTADGNLVTRSHGAFVNVTSDAVGAPCSFEGECAGKAMCLCPTGPAGTSTCVYGPAHGTCAGLCPSGSCDKGQVCANLATASPPGAREPWQTTLCLLQCAGDGDCSPPLRCRTLPGPDSSTWVQGCFGDYPVDVGYGCLDASGSLRDDLCSSGVCANLGLMGMCTMACADRACPPGSDCAVLGDGRQLCLRPCSTGLGCAGDPLLSCVAPGPGDLGFQLVSSGSPPAQTYCAPKPCASDSDCGPSGHCDFASDGHCVARGT